MAATEVAFSIFSSSSLPTSTKFPLFPPRPSQPVTLHMCISSLHPSLKSPPCPFPIIHVETPTWRNTTLQVFSAVGDVEVVEKTENSRETNQKRKLFVLNLPWSFSVVDIKNLFSDCGTVVDVEIIKQKDGRNRGFAFVTMASGEEARAAISKFDSYELSGRIIRVEFAKKFKKPSSSPPADSPSRETRHELYVSNLAWKVRSNNLREFFSSFNPVSSRVVFDSPSGRSAGYGFVSFATKEEAESALSALDGKELFSRPLRLKFSERIVDESSEENDKKRDKQPEASLNGLG